MKILVLSIPFPPSTGGTESVSVALADAFARADHEVCLVTETAAPPGFDDRYPYRVRRNIGPLALLREVARCDVFLHNSISLRNAWPLLICPRRWVIAHHTWLVLPGQQASFAARVKRLCMRGAVSICISKAIAAQFNVRTAIIGNPFDDRLFRPMPEVPRTNDLLFVGNLGPLKGVDLLLRAMHLLRQKGRVIALTIVGDGPDRESLRDLCRELGLDASVRFLGPLRGEALAREYNRHRVCVVPSRWMEPFGVVALEAIACGCIVVGSGGGGLPDAIGPVGLTFPNGNIPALAETLGSALEEGAYHDLRRHAASHLERHKAGVVAQRYLEVMAGNGPLAV